MPKQSSRVSLPFVRGSKVAVDNRTTGRITVVGWNQDIVEATAVSDRGEERVIFRTKEDPSGMMIFLTADYAEQFPDLLSSILGLRSGAVRLEVKLPRHAEIEMIQVKRSEVLVTGIDTPITVDGRSSTITLKDVNEVEVRTRSGDVEVTGARGLVDVVTTRGAIRVRDAGGDVRALSISGDIEIRCVRGRVDVGNTEGAIELVGVGGVDANTMNSNVRFTGTLRDEGRYYLKSMSGRVEMMLRADTPGFTAYLSSYRGAITNDFALKTKQAPNDTSGKRITGRYGNGRAQVTLDSFDGQVKLGKTTATADCNY
jgi:DUF4097 and DUF4098 domain-containing protein YvlB